jgi:sulfur carrier protein ThiS
MMKVTVRLHTVLRRETPQGVVDRVVLDLPEKSTVADALSELGIGQKGESILLVVNGRIVKRNHILEQNDELRLIPAVSGG